MPDCLARQCNNKSVCKHKGERGRVGEERTGKKRNRTSHHHIWSAHFIGRINRKFINTVIILDHVKNESNYSSLQSIDTHTHTLLFNLDWQKQKRKTDDSYACCFTAQIYFNSNSHEFWIKRIKAKTIEFRIIQPEWTLERRGKRYWFVKMNEKGKKLITKN